MRRAELEELKWVVVHGRGVLHTGILTNITKILATAAMYQGNEAYYYMRYDDSPERVYVPMIQYTVIGNPTIPVLPPEEVEPVGEVFDVVSVVDHSMLVHRTSQRALLFDGTKDNCVFVINSTIPQEKVKEILVKYHLTKHWRGKLCTIDAKKYDSDITFGMLGAIAKAWDEISLEALIAACENLGFGEKVDAVKKAYKEAVVEEVDIEPAISHAQV